MKRKKHFISSVFPSINRCQLPTKKWPPRPPDPTSCYFLCYAVVSKNLFIKTLNGLTERISAALRTVDSAKQQKE